MAEMVAYPAWAPRVTFPFVFTDATVASDEDQFIMLLRSMVFPSVHIADADSCELDGEPVSESAGPEGVR